MLKNQPNDLCSLEDQIYKGWECAAVVFFNHVLTVPCSYVIEGTQ